MAYEGYNPFAVPPVGAAGTVELTGHTILLAAYNTTASRFELYLSDIYGNGATAFVSLGIYDGDPATGELLATLAVADADHNNVGAIALNGATYFAVESYTWDMANPFTSETEFALKFNGFVGYEVGEDIVGTIQYPHLDCGSIGSEKTMVGIDVISDAPAGLTVSVGYDQRNLDARTDPFTIPADTMNGMLIPIPVTAPSFDLKLVFEPGQSWEFTAANIYLNK